jgi:hypothetical protein
MACGNYVAEWRKNYYGNFASNKEAADWIAGQE